MLIWILHLIYSNSNRCTQHEIDNEIENLNFSVLIHKRLIFLSWDLRKRLNITNSYTKYQSFYVLQQIDFHSFHANDVIQVMDPNNVLLKLYHVFHPCLCVGWKFQMMMLKPDVTPQYIHSFASFLIQLLFTIYCFHCCNASFLAHLNTNDSNVPCDYQRSQTVWWMDYRWSGDRMLWRLCRTNTRFSFVTNHAEIIFIFW